MSIRRTPPFVAFSLLLALWGAHAQANAVIYDNGVPDLTSAWASDFDFPSQMADDFVLQQGAGTVTDVHWWGLYASSIDPWPQLDTFRLRFFDDSLGGPALIPFYDAVMGPASRSDSGLTAVGFTVYEYAVNVAPLALTPGTTYYISIVNNTPGLEDDWFWAQSSGGGADWHRTLDGLTWTSVATELAFNLTGPGRVVPEPASLALLGMGLAGLVVSQLSRRRRPKRSSNH